MIFDGKAFASEIEAQVHRKGRNLVKKPKIVSVMVGSDPASVLYTKLKKAAAERVGVQFEIVKLDARLQTPDVRKTIEKLGNDENVTGVMIQLPVPNLQGQTLQDVLTGIPLAKDVDGLRWEESGIVPATVRAILMIIDKIAKGKTKFVVVGARGMVGRPLVYFLKKRNVEVVEVEWDTPEPTRMILVGDIVISCTGKPGVVTGEMVKPGAIVIDVGSPRGDMTQEVYDKASVAVAVPGGVGPVTIACLLQNAVELVL